MRGSGRHDGLHSPGIVHMLLLRELRERYVDRGLGGIIAGKATI